MNAQAPLPAPRPPEDELAPASEPDGLQKPLVPDVVIQPAPNPEASAPPLHILAALATVALDWVWFLVELPATVSLAFLPTLVPLALVLGLLDVAVVTLVQRFLAGESWGRAAAKGLAMGIIAGVPYPVFGTIIGVPLAAWAGVREVQKLLPPRRQE